MRCRTRVLHLSSVLERTAIATVIGACSPEKGRRMVNIKAWQNGPYLVEGDNVTVLDWNGDAYQVQGRSFALCRCGGSAKKPFCDGTHSNGCRQVAEYQRSARANSMAPQ